MFSRAWKVYLLVALAITVSCGVTRWTKASSIEPCAYADAGQPAGGCAVRAIAHEVTN